MNAVEFKLIDNELCYRTLMLLEDEDTRVNEDGDDVYCNRRLVFRGWTDWALVPKSK